MATVLDESDREALCARIAKLTAASPAQWGRMSVDAMLAHLNQSARLALGELPVASKNRRLFQVFPLKHLILYVLPFPKSAPTAPELLVAAPGRFETERQTLKDLLCRLGAGPREGAGPNHPLFGPLSRQEWGALAHKHTDHHLRQFGA